MLVAQDQLVAVLLGERRDLVGTRVQLHPAGHRRNDGRGVLLHVQLHRGRPPDAPLGELGIVVVPPAH